jgi:hypothetical protein
MSSRNWVKRTFSQRWIHLDAHWVYAEWISAYAQTLRKFAHSIGISMKNEVRRTLSLRKWNFNLYCVNSEWISAHTQSTQDFKKLRLVYLWWRISCLIDGVGNYTQRWHLTYSMCESDLRFADLGSPYAELMGNQIPLIRNLHRTSIARRKCEEDNGKKR